MKRKENTVHSTHLASIDAIRGWAILLVILVHTGGVFTELPWPVKKITNLGWYGVQLFFIASAYTLIMSWHRQSSGYWKITFNFFIRRYFRIVPMYYLGALLYYIIRPPLDSFNIDQLLVNLALLNAWSPLFMTTVEKAWQVVPGGWSIGVEFSFYFIFPILVVLFNSLLKSLIFLVTSILLAYFSYHFFYDDLTQQFGMQASDNFLFFWLPNQLGVFALGFVLYFITQSENLQVRTVRTIISRYSKAIIVILSVIVLIYSQIGTNKHFSNLFPWLPVHYWLSFYFFICCLIMLDNETPLLTNKYMIKLGQVSFSAYVLHFAVIQYFSYVEQITATGYWVILYFSRSFVLITLVTYFLSRLCFQYIEIPFINLGRNICKRLITS